MTAPSADALLALAIALSFAAGLNLSAVLVTLGLLAQTGVLILPAPIAIVGEWWVIAIASVLFVVESLADKIPAFDLVWNAAMTFIRVPAAAVLAYSTTEALSPGMQMVVAAAGGGIALSAHTAKLAARGAVSASPEPFSNLALSLVDDVVAVALTWFATQYPYVAAGIVLGLCVAAVILIRWLVRTTRVVFSGAARQWANARADRQEPRTPTTAGG